MILFYIIDTINIYTQSFPNRFRTSKLDKEKLEAVRIREELKKLREEESERAMRAEVQIYMSSVFGLKITTDFNC